MTFTFAMVCEAEADFRTASDLADRVLCADVDWITEDLLDDSRRWRGRDDSLPYRLWTQVAADARRAGFRVHGHFDDGPGKPDAMAARRALWLIEQNGEPLDAVLLFRDDDRQSSRREGINQARRRTTLRCPVIVGLAHLKRECWVLVGFEPLTADEDSRLADLRQVLGFDPRIESHRLTDRHDHQERSAKRVLRLLTNEDREREAACWSKVPLELLRGRGDGTGLPEYLGELRSALVPLFTGPRST